MVLFDVHSIHFLALKNKLLATLPEQELSDMLPFLHLVDVKARDVLFSVRDQIKVCHFPLNGLWSMTAATMDGDLSEVGMIGNEGFAGSPAILSDEPAGYQVLVQVAGRAMQIGAPDLRKLFQQSEALRGVLLRFVNAQLTMTAQAAACNAIHLVEQRLARWLLMVQDRIRTADLPLTHEFVAIMLGSRRPTVTDTLGALERAGLIKAGRGHITVLSRERLKEAACECYGVIAAATGTAGVAGKWPSLQPSEDGKAEVCSAELLNRIRE